MPYELRLWKIVRESLGELLEIPSSFLEDDGILVWIHSNAVRAERVGRDGSDGKTADDSGLLVIKQCQDFRVILGHQEGSAPELGTPVFEAVDQLGHVRRIESTVARLNRKAQRVPRFSRSRPTREHQRV